MIWPFRKKNRGPAPWPPTSSEDCSWSVGVSENGESGPLIVRLNTTAADWRKHPELSIKLGFAIPLREPNPGGLPNPDENAALDDIEDQIVAAVAAQTISIQVLALTNGEMKEFVFYIPEGVDIKTLHESLQAQVPSHEVQCMAERDPDWDIYASFEQMMS
ncbi:MAG: DUF695 domain-containing protein [Pirellulales bacterium]